MKMWIGLVFVGLGCGFNSFGQETKPLYSNDFEQAEVGKLPDEFLVLDGGFTVHKDGPNKFLELPGAPLDSYGLLFGPAEKEGVEASARILSTGKGRRVPTFALGVHGVGGYRVQVNPAKQVVELFRGENLKTSAPYTWVSGKWTQLRLRAEKTASGWKIAGKAWTEGESEPAAWTITTEDAEELPAGRAGIFGSPYSGTPIRYDDLTVTSVAKK